MKQARKINDLTLQIAEKYGRIRNPYATNHPTKITQKMVSREPRKSRRGLDGPLRRGKEICID